MTGPDLVRERADLAARLDAQDRTAPTRRYRRAVVMTMGALHAGHLALVEKSLAVADHVVVTIFVNPLQFSPSEDFDRYPRTLDRDLELLAALDGSERITVFAPPSSELYPDGEPTVRVSAGWIGTVLEGASRPGHLDGVLTVVLKLLHLTRPDMARFGRKDAQQLAAIRRMVRDLDLDVHVTGHEIVRESDGLARSSRNAYLSDDEHRQALALSHALTAGAVRALDGAGPDAVIAATQQVLREGVPASGVRGVDSVDYVALVDDDFAAVSPDHAGPATLLIAARVGNARLIDNDVVTLAGPVGAGRAAIDPDRGLEPPTVP